MKSFNFFSNHVKNLPILLAFLTIFTGNVWGDEETVNIADVANAESWGNGIKYASFTSGIFTFSVTNGGANTGKYYSSNESWRVYGSENGAIEITVPSTHKITAIASSPSVTFSKTNDQKWTYSYSGSGNKAFTSFTITYSAAASYTITAVSNNNSWGTVSGTTTITATPAAGYRVVAGDGGYTVTSGTATVTNNGDNTFSVIPSSNCEVQINFEAIPTYTIRFYNNGSLVSTQNVVEGENAVKPSPDPSTCEGYTFVGWWTEELAEDNTVEKTWITSFAATKDQDYYAAYSHSDDGGGSTDGSKTFNFASIASAKGWINGTAYTTVTDAPVTLSAAGGGNNGKYYTSDNSWRMYSGGTVNVSVESGVVTSVSSSPSRTFTITAGTASFSPSTTTQFTSITVEYTVSGGPTYYTTSANCIACTNIVTLTKGTPENGSFNLNKADGDHETCKAAGLVVNVTNITPASGYQFKEIQQTGVASAIVDNNAKTVTYPQNTNGSSTITVVFELIPTYTVTWSANGDESNTEQYYEGDDIVFPGTATGCEGKVFRGWSETTVSETDVEPSYVTSATMPAHDVTYYAVYAEASGGGTPLSASYTFTNLSWNASEGNWTSGKNGAGFNNGGVQVTTGASGANATCPNSYSDITSIVVSYCTNGSSGAGSITMNVNGTEVTESVTKTGGTTARNLPFDFSATTPTGAPRITVTCTTNSIYVCGVTINYGSGVSYSGYTTSCGASISAQNIGWMTAASGQKVKVEVPVTAKNFDDPATLSATSDNSHFAVSLAATAVPAGTTGLATTLTVEYTPAEASVKETDVHITLTAGDKVRVITVNGRSLPEEFLIISKKYDKWYALPADMNSGANQYDGVIVTPNNETTPTFVPSSPGSVIYSAYSVAADRYADAGSCLRLQGNGGRCLWSNGAVNGTTIKNDAMLAGANDSHYEWALQTEDGSIYTIINPAHPDAAANRQLALGGSGGTQYGLYKTATTFYIVPAGCTSMPQDVRISTRRVDATFAWISSAPSVTIDIYTNEGMTEGHRSATATSAPYIFSGLEESTHYWFKLTPGSNTDCAVTGDFTTTGPIIDIVEWEENGVVLFIDKGDINPKIVIDGQEEHGSISGGGNATELFFAKYFEGAGSMKLVSIFNGTQNPISLSGYKFYDRHAGSHATSYGGDTEYDLSSLGSIAAGQEIIFFSRPLASETELSDCSNTFLTEMAAKSDPSNNPRWIECADGKIIGTKIQFNGNDALILKKGDNIIDVIGSLGTPGQGDNCKGEDAWEGTIKNMDFGKTPSDPSFATFFDASSKHPVTTSDSTTILNAFGIDLANEYIDITTARCIFFRDNRVTSGDSAVSMNTGGNFKTFTNHIEGGVSYKAEWYGRSVCMTLSTANKEAAGVTSDAQATCNSYQDIANMDYNQYYIDWHNIDPGTELSNFTVDPDTKEYTIPIDDMRQYACLQLRFQLVNGGNVLTEASQQVPIVVVGNDVDTNDPLFSELVIDQSTHLPSYSHSVERCKDCDVVILGSAKLTKGPDSDEKDVPRVGNVKVYPGGKLVVPSGTTYRMKSLALRRQEDEVATANVEGDITFIAPAASPAPARRDNGEKQIRKAATGKKNTYFDLRVDPTNWHYFSLPYDCNVADIRYANPEETAIPVLGTDYLIKWYNGEKRAATQAGGCWEMVAADGTLKAGVGYIFSIPGDGSVRREFRFPMDNEVVEQETADKIAAPVYGYGCDNTEEVRPNHRGWNLLGNPYMMPYTSDITNPLLTGYIVEDHSTDPWDGHYTFDVDPTTHTYLRYIVEPVNNGWSEYRQVSIEDYPMTPFTCYFVQVGGIDPAAEQGVEFHVTHVNRSPIRRAPAEYEEVEDTHPVWCAVTLTNPNGEKDETTMLISNDFTDEYDMMNDLVKMRGTYYQYAQITTKPVLASRNNEGEMAFNALPDSSALAGIPLNYFAASQGSYTIAYNDKYDKDKEVKEVKLWDKTTNQWYNLMDEPYTFNTARTDNKDRFVLSVRVERKQNQVTTSIEDLNSYSGDKPRKLLINGHVYIQRGKDIYDVTGKQVENF